MLSVASNTMWKIIGLLYLFTLFTNNQLKKIFMPSKKKKKKVTNNATQMINFEDIHKHEFVSEGSSENITYHCFCDVFSDV